MRRSLRLIAALALLAAPGSAFAHGDHQHHTDRCAQPALPCATAATPAFGPDGSLWLAWVAAGRVVVARSTDLGQSFESAVPLGEAPARIDTGPDSRPKIVVDGEGHAFVAYSVFKDDHYNGEVLFTRSLDGGQSFEAPRPITADKASQRFATLALDPAGKLFAAWIDKRNAVAARKSGGAYPGAALAFAWSEDGGASFAASRIAKDNSCECCRLGVAFAGPGRPVVAFRNLFDGGKVRDHAVATFSDPSTIASITRVAVDDWAIEACPHHGPSLSVGPDGAYHVTWFTEGKARQGSFYARSTDGGASFSAPMRIGDPDRQAGRAQVLASGGAVWLAWQEFDGEQTTIFARRSGDGGASWSAPREIARTMDEADHPLLVAYRDHVFVSWLTRAEGYRLLPVEDAE
jgi:hypothetical protein